MFTKQQRLNIDKLFRFCDAQSQRELGEICGVANETISHWIRHGGVPEPQADRIAISLGVHPSAIWGDEWFNLAQQIAV
jgi:lambda repressor-like predicted transcriptional regulator